MLERLASALRAGTALGPALVAVAVSTPDPLRSELALLSADITHGASVSDALDRWGANAGDSPAVRLVVGALGLGAQAGGELARAADRLASTLRERAELQAEVRALATQARSSAWVLAAAPVGFTALVSSIEPAVIRTLLTTPVGLACLLVGVALDAAGAAWMARIVASAS
jgi:tight adherence protein B